MRVMITGAAGFVGPNVAQALRRVCSENVTIIPTSRKPTSVRDLGQVTALDVTDRNAVEAAVLQHRPSHVVHLAGIAAPAVAASAPGLAWRVHVRGTLNVAHAIMAKAPNCWLIHAGTGLVYGESAREGSLDEEALLAPLDDYGVTKAAADLALGALARGGLKCVRLRPFNHAGVGQAEAFVVPAFAMQIAKIEAGLAEPIIRVGNLEAERDFLDVRDLATAYALVVKKSEVITSGTILNIASGKAWRIARVLEVLLSLSRVPIKVEYDPARARAVDVPHFLGNAKKIRDLLDWKAEHPFEMTLAKVLEDCRQRISRQASTISLLDAVEDGAI